jgi:hypothetical protein
MKIDKMLELEKDVVNYIIRKMIINEEIMEYLDEKKKKVVMKRSEKRRIK